MHNLGRCGVVGIETLCSRYRDITGVNRSGFEVKQPLPSTAFVVGYAVKFNFILSENYGKIMTDHESNFTTYQSNKTNKTITCKFDSIIRHSHTT
jgi:hypothetical protein